MDLDKIMYGIRLQTSLCNSPFLPYQHRKKSVRYIDKIRRIIMEDEEIKHLHANKPTHIYYIFKQCSDRCLNVSR